MVWNRYVWAGLCWFLAAQTASQDQNIDVRWDRYVQGLIEDAKSYVNDPINRILPDRVLQNQFYSKRKGWSLPGYGEVSFVAVLYTKETEFKKGKACGGAVVTRDRVLTLCACIESYINYYKGTSEPAHTEFDIEGREIFVTYNQLRFIPDKAHTLVSPDDDQCYPEPYEDTIAASIRWQRELVVNKFKPPIRQTFRSFMPWPSVPYVLPATLNDATESEKRVYLGARAFALTYGLQQQDPGQAFFNDFGLPIDVHGSLVNWELELDDYGQCQAAHHLNAAEMLLNRTLCYKLHGWELCGNEVPGFPVMRDNQVQGLITLGQVCEKNRVLMIRAFTPDYAKHLNKFVPKNLLTLLNRDRTPMFRDGDLDYLSYFIWPDTDYFPRSHSRSPRNAFTAYPFFLLPIVANFAV